MGLPQCSLIVFVLIRIGAGLHLSFPAAYYAKGTINLPYGDIVEPFEAWVDMTAGNSRLDTYNGEDIDIHTCTALLE
jgi:hypothetical protein